MTQTAYCGGRRVVRPRGLAATLAMAVVLAGLAMANPGTAQAQTSRVPGTPCNKGTVACVALGKDGFNATTWFIKDDKVLRGPMASSSGGPGKDTPTGTWKVISKDVDHVSSETTTNGRPSAMPYSVFYSSSGYAFHGGSTVDKRTAGCIRLSNGDASYLFNHISIGDSVQIVQGDGNYNDDKPKSKKDKGGLLGL